MDDRLRKQCKTITEAREELERYERQLEWFNVLLSLIAFLVAICLLLVYD